MPFGFEEPVTSETRRLLMRRDYAAPEKRVRWQRIQHQIEEAEKMGLIGLATELYDDLFDEVVLDAHNHLKTRVATTVTANTTNHEQASLEFAS